MSSARNLKFTPQTPEGPAVPRKRGFTNLDNATDLTLLGRLPNALVKPALFLMSRRYTKRGTHWGEIAAYAERSQTRTSSALEQLAQMGHAESRNGEWFWRSDSRKRTGFETESAAVSTSKPTMDNQKEAVQYGKKLKPKEVKNQITNKVIQQQQYIQLNSTSLPTPEVGGGMAQNFEQITALTGITANDQAPSQVDISGWQAPENFAGGAAAGETGGLEYGAFDQKACKAAQQGVDLSANPHPTPAEPLRGVLSPNSKDASNLDAYNLAIANLRNAELLPDWREWVTFSGLKLPAQRGQIAYWAQWVDAGQADDLKREARDIMLCNFNHPFKALQGRMERAAQVAQVAQANTAELQAAYGQALCQSGERRTAPDGRVWTVECVEYGAVYFEELGAPLDQADVHVAKWVLDGQQ